MVIELLTRIVRGANIQEMSKAQAFLALSSFLTGNAGSQYEAGVEMVSPEKGGVSSWPEAVHYLVRNYAQLSGDTSAIFDLQAVFQGPTETE